ncbi:MAG: hypothetical protein PUP92_38720 [Rhizonema sp. PD38]|nr:hypothetical protein [Rhizonema sp. PD38]
MAIALVWRLRDVLMVTKDTLVLVNVGITPLLVAGIVLAKPAGDVIAVPPESAVRAATDIGF